jgi:hypothetical protein
MLKKKELLRIGIENLKTYLQNNDLPMAKEVLIEAIDCVKAKKIRKIGMCYQ